MEFTPLTLSFFLSSCCIVLLSLRSIYYWILLQKSRRELKLKHRCSAPIQYVFKDPIFGLDEILDATQAAKSHTSNARIRGLYDKYGHTFQCQTLAYSALNTIEPENFEAVLITNFKDYKISSPRLDALSPLMGKSILLSDGAEWEHSRALHRPSFSKNQISDFTRLEIHVQNLFRVLPRNRSIVDLAPFFFRLTADAITDFMFGESISSLTAPENFQDRFTTALRNAQLGGERRARFGRLARFLPQREFWRSVRQAHAFIDQHVERAIMYRDSFVIEGKNEGKKEATHHGKLDERYIFLRELSKLTEDREVLRGELLTIFLIGRDATASLISSLFFVLARRPDIMQKLRVELDRIQGRPPTFEQLKSMRYLRSCVYESKLALSHSIILRLLTSFPYSTSIISRSPD